VQLFTPGIVFGQGNAETPLKQPPVCSAIQSAGNSQSPFCTLRQSGGTRGSFEVHLALTATTGPVLVGGYVVTTGHYNDGYLPPVVELNPGDTLNVSLRNGLSQSGTAPAAAGHGAHMTGAAAAGDATNLHTHGLLVSPNNASDPAKGNGDNIFVSVGPGTQFDYSIPIPTSLPASLFDGPAGTIIPHPSGLFWYHSHSHGVSATQVAGGMAGILSIGARNANLAAATDPAESVKATETLRENTDVSYLMLRDIQLKSQTPPGRASGSTPAQWMHEAGHNPCYPDGGDAQPEASKREGFCQNSKDPSEIWLFTVNGQRFPTLRVGSGRNALLRIANLSANVTYHLRFAPEKGNAPLKFDLLSVDGVVPGKPADASALKAAPPQALQLNELVLMPAARAEIFLPADEAAGAAYVLQTCEQHTGLRVTDTTPDGSCKKLPGNLPKDGDHWPEIQLAKVVFEPAPAAKITAAPRVLNRALAQPQAKKQAAQSPGQTLPSGCVRDLDKAAREHRRITFSAGVKNTWRMQTDLVKPKSATGLFDPNQVKDFQSDKEGKIGFVSFDAYMRNGAVNWDASDQGPKHTCIQLSNGHGQLWEIFNPTNELHNFHIHQMKFRLAQADDLIAYGIDPGKVALGPSQVKLALLKKQDRNGISTWHDTIPVEANSRVFIVLNFDAGQQVGRFVYHCHILEHEDAGLMAPVEVIP
jgi:FtsP/CotA-like multicopper oxidase with cupredoxin domain